MKKILLMFFGVLMTLPAFALDFYYTYEGQTVKYTVLDEDAKTVSVINNGTMSGNLIIPSVAKDGDVEYSVTSIGEFAFSDCSGLTSVTIPNSVTEIGEDAFFGCSGLTELIIPNSVTSIGDWALYGCSGLTEVIIPNSVISIGRQAFRGCSSLASVIIPNSVTSIGDWALYGCSGLETVYFNAENCTACGSLNLPAFPSTIEVLKIGESVKIIPSCAFSKCSGLASVTIPTSVTSIGEDAFNGCSGLTSVTIPGSVTSIGKYAFQYCIGLTEVTIPNSVTSIGSYAFSNCSGLSHVYYGATNPINCSKGVFSANTYESATLHVPEEAIAKCKEIDPWKNFLNIMSFESSGVDEISSDSSINNAVDIYNMQGVCIKRNATVDDVRALTPGLYIIGGKKMLVK